MEVVHYGFLIYLGISMKWWINSSTPNAKYMSLNRVIFGLDDFSSLITQGKILILTHSHWCNCAESYHLKFHDDVIKWKHFPHYWPVVRGIHRSPVNSPHKGQWRGALILPLICVWINGWVNNHEAGDWRRYPAHYDVTVMLLPFCPV